MIGITLVGRYEYVKLALVSQSIILNDTTLEILYQWQLPSASQIGKPTKESHLHTHALKRESIRPPPCAAPQTHMATPKSNCIKAHPTPFLLLAIQSTYNTARVHLVFH